MCFCELSLILAPSDSDLVLAYRLRVRKEVFRKFWDKSAVSYLILTAGRIRR